MRTEAQRAAWDRLHISPKQDAYIRELRRQCERAGVRPLWRPWSHWSRQTRESATNEISMLQETLKSVSRNADREMFSNHGRHAEHNVYFSSRCVGDK